jgi:hypothetical protein
MVDGGNPQSWGMGLPFTAATRIALDAELGIVRGWFDPAASPGTPGDDSPVVTARQFLARAAAAFGWQPDLPDLADRPTRSASEAVSVRFVQTHQGVEVDRSEVVVNLDASRRVYAVYSQYHYGIPADLDPRVRSLEVGELREITAAAAGAPTELVDEPSLIVFRHGVPPRPLRWTSNWQDSFPNRITGSRMSAPANPRQGTRATYLVAWEVRGRTSDPPGLWRFVVDAQRRRVVERADLLSRAMAIGS